MAEACVLDESSNWCIYLLHVLFKACEDIYKRATYFIYRYLVISIAMVMSCIVEGRNMAEVLDGEPLVLAYAP